MLTSDQDQWISPTRLLEMLPDRFDAFEATANSSTRLARVALEEEQAMDVRVAEAVLEFGVGPRIARDAATISGRSTVNGLGGCWGEPQASGPTTRERFRSL